MADTRLSMGSDRPVAVFLLLMVTLHAGHSVFFGDSVNVQVVSKKDGALQLLVQHRQHGRNNCTNEPHFTCDSGACSDFTTSPVQQGDRDASGKGSWCQSEAQFTADIRSGTRQVGLRNSGCCWSENIFKANGWSSSYQLDLGVRSDTRSLNKCPVTTSVSSLRVPQNCFSHVSLLAHDPDGDRVRCTFSNGTGPELLVDTTHCTITKDQELSVGVHVLEVQLQDLPNKDITLTYSDGASTTVTTKDEKTLCSIKLQFTLQILPPVLNCKLGDVTPKFLSKTPMQGDVLHATVGQPFTMDVEAEAQKDSIYDFQVSGPHNMSKEVHAGGRADMRLRWTPQESDLHSFSPVCFTAETPHSQSDMRCAVIMVTRSSISRGNGGVNCKANEMTVFLEKASMPGIDERFLELKDPSCSLTSNSTHIMGTISFKTCGTELKDTGEYLVFTNQIRSKELSKEVIVRRKMVAVDFSCQFPKSTMVKNSFTLQNSDYIFTESSFGSFGYAFNVYRDSSYKQKFEAKSYPLELQLMQPMYMGITAESELTNLQVFVESCRATPDENAENPMYYDLIKDGCLKDETVQVQLKDLMSFNFEFKMFKFNGIYNMVYINCFVMLCDSRSSSSRCAQGCIPEAPSRRRRSVGGETNGHYVSQGPFQLLDPEEPDDTVPDGALKPTAVSPEVNRRPDTLTASPVHRSTPGSRESRFWVDDLRTFLSSKITLTIFAGTFLASVGLLGVVVAYFVRGRSSEDQKALLRAYM